MAKAVVAAFKNSGFEKLKIYARNVKNRSISRRTLWLRIHQFFRKPTGRYFSQCYANRHERGQGRNGFSLSKSVH